MELNLWYPSYENNLGILSTLLKNEINQVITNFGGEIHETYFINKHTFHLKISIKKSQYERYIKNMLTQRYGEFHKIDEINEGDELLGRLITPNQVGFGIFGDIGVRGPKQDVLLPLYQLREDLNNPNLSVGKIVDKMGWIDSLPLLLVIREIKEKDNKKLISAGISKKYLELVQSWNQSNTEKLLITKKLTTSISKVVKNQNLMDYIQSIDTFDPLTTIIDCKEGTRANGLIPIIGPHLKGAPIGIYTPQ